MRRGLETGVGRLAFPLALGLSARALDTKKRPLESGPSLGRKRPRRAYDDESSRAQHMLRRTKFNTQSAAAVTNGGGVLLMHHL
jgi:hypothetical protein